MKKLFSLNRITIFVCAVIFTAIYMITVLLGELSLGTDYLILNFFGYFAAVTVGVLLVSYLYNVKMYEVREQHGTEVLGVKWSMTDTAFLVAIVTIIVIGSCSVYSLLDSIPGALVVAEFLAYGVLILSLLIIFAGTVAEYLRKIVKIEITFKEDK